jgi:hypothetical protein
VNLSLARGGGAQPDHGHFGVIAGLSGRDGDLARRSIEKDIKFGRLIAGDAAAGQAGAEPVPLRPGRQPVRKKSP